MYVMLRERKEGAIVVFLLGCVCSQYLQTWRREGEGEGGSSAFAGEEMAAENELNRLSE